MLDSSARRPSRAVWAAALLPLLLALLAGCADEQKTAPKPSPTPLARLNTLQMQVPRIDFCSLVPDGAVSDALGGEPDSDASYGNGDKESLPGVGTDVVHEIGCSWTGKDGAAARAWVFARPVTPAFGRAVIASGASTKGCRAVAGPPFGQPSTTQLCRLSGGQQRLRHAGLFGQSWLTCELDGHRPRPHRAAQPGRRLVRRGREHPEHAPVATRPTLVLFGLVRSGHNLRFAVPSGCRNSRRVSRDDFTTMGHRACWAAVVVAADHHSAADHAHHGGDGVDLLRRRPTDRARQRPRAAARAEPARLASGEAGGCGSTRTRWPIRDDHNRVLVQLTPQARRRPGQLPPAGRGARARRADRRPRRTAPSRASPRSRPCAPWPTCPAPAPSPRR